jgi:hypothetical protein
MRVTTRAAAVAAQLHVYRGRPCLRGHDGLRYKASRNCVVCTRERALAKEKSRRDARPASRPRPELCECCAMSPAEGKTLHWDHDHATGKFRGWLCPDCNIALGFARDSPYRLLLMVDYLQRSRQSA